MKCYVKGIIYMADMNTINGLHYEMMRRCYNPKSISYKDYGAKGISVCSEWHDKEAFKAWCQKQGWRRGLRINRIDSIKEYSPENCFLGEKNTAKHGYNQLVKARAEENKRMKSEIGLKRYGDSPLFGIYHGMLARCYNQKHVYYGNYGGRGIKVCDAWIGKEGFKNFYIWAMENGYEKNLSIDRIENDKGYYPGNCRFVEFSEQINNRRTTLRYFYNGKLTPLGVIAKEEGIKYGLLYRRLRKKGMSLENAIKEIKSIS